jgi:hypothetical protein
MLCAPRYIACMHAHRSTQAACMHAEAASMRVPWHAAGMRAHRGSPRGSLHQLRLSVARQACMRAYIYAACMPAEVYAAPPQCPSCPSNRGSRCLHARRGYRSRDSLHARREVACMHARAPIEAACMRADRGSLHARAMACSLHARAPIEAALEAASLHARQGAACMRMHQSRLPAARRACMHVC